MQGQASGWELTLHRQKLRAQALADELGALIEQAARKVLGRSCLRCPGSLLLDTVLLFSSTYRTRKDMLHSP